MIGLRKNWKIRNEIQDKRKDCLCYRHNHNNIIDICDYSGCIKMKSKTKKDIGMVIAITSIILGLIAMILIILKFFGVF